MEKLLKQIFYIAGIILFLSAAYYLVVFLPQKQFTEVRLRYRSLCQEQQKKDFAVIDAMSPALARVALTREGYADEQGNFVDEEAWLNGCIEKKMNSDGK
jgi:hypothetical protein